MLSMQGHSAFMENQSMSPERILRFPEVKRLSGLSRSSIYFRISEGLFPRPILLGRRMVGWRELEVAAVNAARIRGATDDEIRALVHELDTGRAKVA
jgi:prophage regulatory protein